MARRGRNAGFLLVEYLIATAIGALVVLALTAIMMYTGGTVLRVANYVDLNATGLRAMDTMTRDIRQCVALTASTSNQLVFNDGVSPAGLSFTFDPARRTLVREQGGISSTLLTECDSLQFSIYQRTPLPGTYDQYPTALAMNCKVVAVKWTCSRTILGLKSTTETDEQAKIVIRKH